jgi:hypothetical protein
MNLSRFYGALDSTAISSEKASEHGGMRDGFMRVRVHFYVELAHRACGVSRVSSILVVSVSYRYRYIRNGRLALAIRCGFAALGVAE